MFDLDNTLYPSDCNLFAEIDTRMGDFIAARFPGVSLEERRGACANPITTRWHDARRPDARLHDVCPNAFLDYVHDIDLSVIALAPQPRPSPRRVARAQIRLHNGSRCHAELVIARLGLDGRFDDVFDIHAAEFIPKPERAAYERFMGAHAVAAGSAAMFDDLPHNLRTAHSLGMTTVLVAAGIPIILSTPRHRRLGRASPPTFITAPTRSRLFLADIGAMRAEEADRAAADGAYCCL